MLKKIAFWLVILMAAFAMLGCDNGSTDGDDPVDIDIITCMYQDDDTGIYSLIAMRPDGTGRKWLYKGEPAMDPKQAFIGSDCKTLLFANDSDDDHVYICDLSTGQKTELFTDGACETPVFSSDMSKVYVSDHNRLWVIDVDSGNRDILYDESKIFNPSFTADGRIVFCTDNNMGWGRDIAIMNADGSEIRTIKEAEEDEGDIINCYMHPFSVPVLNRILYIKSHNVDGDRKAAEEYSICIMDTQGENEITLKSSSSERYITPSANAEGTKLAYFLSTNRNEGNIVVYSFNAANASLSSIKIAYNFANEKLTIWRPQFALFNREVYKALEDF